MTKQTDKKPGKISFAFADPEPVHGRDIISLLGVFPSFNGQYYVPPVDLPGLSKLRYANPQHGSCIVFRRNMAENAYQGGGLSVGDLSSAVTDFLTFGHCYVQFFYNRLGQPVRLGHVPAINMRVRTDGAYRQLRANLSEEDIDFQPGEIAMIKEYDTHQQIYGIPDWLGGMQPALLGESATLFRRKYYINGAHLGYILYTNDENFDEESEQMIKDAIKNGKGIGNFKTAYFHIPGGHEKAFQIIPIGDISQKDEFANVKSISANDVREAHRVPPVLMGVVPTGTSSLGDPLKFTATYIETEVKSLCRKFERLNDLLPASLQLRFSYTTTTTTPQGGNA